MHWIAIALLALVLGFVNAYVSPLISARIPASVQQNRITQAFFSGAVILVAVFVSAFLLSLFGLSVKKGS
jgi:hypothetical protein